MAKGLPRILVLAILLLFAAPVEAGSVNDPEILDAPDDSRFATPDRTVSPQLDIVKAWIQSSGKDLVFAIQLAAAESIPARAAYVWHFTPEGPDLEGATRFYFRLNYTADGSALESFGGIYQGAKGGLDSNGNKRYDYFRGNDNSDIRHSFDAGSPGTIKFRYPVANFGDDIRGLVMKGLFVTTYIRGQDDTLIMIDYAAAADGSDYVHTIKEPWYAQFVPGPGIGLVTAAGVAVLAIATRKARTR